MHGYIILLTCTVSWLCLQRCCYNLKYLSIYDDSTCVLLEFTKFYYWVIIKPCSNITPCWICSFNFYRRILKFHSCLLKYSIITQQAWFNYIPQQEEASTTDPQRKKHTLHSQLEVSLFYYSSMRNEDFLLAQQQA